MESGEEGSADFEAGSSVGADFFDVVEGEGDLADGGEGYGHSDQPSESGSQSTTAESNLKKLNRGRMERCSEAVTQILRVS